MWAAVIAGVVVIVVAMLYRRSVLKAKRHGHTLRGAGEYGRLKRDIRRDNEAWQAQNFMTPPPRPRSMDEGRRAND
jgi:hypothetical protein